MHVVARKDYCKSEKLGCNMALFRIGGLETFNGTINGVSGLWMKAPHTGAILLRGDARWTSSGHITDSGYLVAEGYEPVKTTLVIED